MMFEGIPVAALTPPVLLGLGVLMLMLGRIVPRRTLQDAREEASRWRQAYEAEREARAIADAQSAELLEVTKTTKNILVALFGTAEKMQRTEGTDVAVPTPTQNR